MPEAAPAGTTVTLPPGGVTRTAGNRASAGFREEVRRLLRRQLLIVHVGVGIFFVLLMVFYYSAAAGGGQPVAEAVTGFVALAECWFGALVLWRRPGLSLRALRAWEVTHFGLHAVLSGWRHFAAFAFTEWEPPPSDRVTNAVFWENSKYIMIIVVYGVMIPNTIRRSLTGVALLITVPVVATLAAGAWNPSFQPYVAYLSVAALLGEMLPGIVAVYAATRTQHLQRQAFEAERRAEQIGQYTLKQRLGKGGMGEVWLAEHRLLKRPCAVKFIRADLAANPATAARFAREVRAVITLTHFNTIRIYDYGQADDGSFYYVMEYLEGPTLESLVGRSGPLPPGRAVYLLLQLCGALAEAHAAGMVHRDLKPGNVIVAALGGQRDVVKLLDFGLVQDLSAADAEGRLTEAGVVMGTPAYMCPEQAGGSSCVDARGDVYSLGAVAFFLLTGRSPFACFTVGEYLSAHLTRPAPDARAVRPDVPEDLALVVAKCLAKDPKARFQTAEELGAALAACACTGEWSASEAAEWWAHLPSTSADKPTGPTASFHQPEPTPT